jgi:hypothetical protein
MAQARRLCHRFDYCSLLGLARSLGDELAHLLLYFGGVALGAGDLAGFIILEAHDPHKLLAAFVADVFIGGHGSPPDEGDESMFIIINLSITCNGSRLVQEKYLRDAEYERLAHRKVISYRICSQKYTDET